MIRKIIGPPILAMLLAAGCFKQETPVIETPALSAQEQLRSYECSKLRLASDVLLQDNVLTFFRCTGDDLEFPGLYQAVVETGPEAWNHLMAPIDDLYFDHKERREHYLGLFRDLDRKQGLDDFGRIMNALNDKNIWDAFFAMLPDPQGINTHPLLSKQDFKKVFSNLKLETQEIADIVAVLNGVMEAAKSPMPQLTELMRELTPLEGFQSSRVQWVGEIFDLFNADEITAQDRAIYPQLFIDENNQLTYLAELLGSTRFHESYVKEVLEFPLVQYPSERAAQVPGHQIIHDLRQLYAIAKGDRCQCAGVPEMSFSFAPELKALLRTVGEGKEDETQLLLTEMPWKTALADQACDLYENLWQQKQWDLKNTMAKTQDFLSNSQNFQLMAFLQGVAMKYADELYWPKYIEKGVAHSSLDLLSLALSVKTELAGPLAQFANHLPTWIYPPLARMTHYFLSEDHLDEVAVLGRFWKALPFEHQVYLLKIIDAHFAEGTNPADLFHFYQSMVQEFPQTLPLIQKYYTGDEQQLEKTYQAFFKIVKAHHGDVVHSELKRWLTRDQILKVVQFLSSQVPPQSGFNAELMAQAHGLFEAKVSGLASIESSLNLPQLHACQQSTSELNMAQLVESFPPECDALKNEMPLALILSGFHQLEKTYQARFSEQSLLTVQGLLSWETMANSLEAIKRIDQKMIWHVPASESSNAKAQAFSGITGVLRYLSYLNLHFTSFVDQCFELVGDLTKATAQAFARPETQENPARDVVHQAMEQLVDYPAAKLNDHLATGGEIIRTYRSFADPQEIIFDQQWSCPLVVKSDIGPYPRCPSRDRVANILIEAVHYLTRKFPGRPRLGEQMIESLNPKGHFKIPLESPESKRYSTDMEEILVWAYDIGSQKKKVTFIHRPSEKEETMQMTYADQIDAVIREISFMDNVYGSMWVNEVARSTDYDKTVEKQEKQIKLLRNLGGLMRLIPRKDKAQEAIEKIAELEAKDELSAKQKKKLAQLKEKVLKGEIEDLDRWLPEDSEVRLKNSVTTYEGLKANNYKYLETRSYSATKYRQHGQFIIALMAMLSSSSADESQNISTFDLPHDPRLGANHNGGFLVKLVEIYGNAHTNRWIRSRLGANDQELNLFLSSWKFRRFNDQLVPDLDFELAQKSFSEFAHGYQGDKRQQWQLIINDVVTELSSLKQDEIMELEALLGEITVSLSYIGSDESYSSYQHLYQHNNPAQLLTILPLLADHYFQLKRLTTLVDVHDMKLIRGARKLVSLINEKLRNPQTEVGRGVYLFINEAFYQITRWLLTGEGEQRGIEKGLASLASTGPEFDHTLKQIRRRLDSLKHNWPEHLARNFEQDLAQNLINLKNDSELDVLFIRSYLHRQLMPTSASYLEWERLLALAAQKQQSWVSWVRENVLVQLDKMATWVEQTLELVELKN